MLLLEQDIKYQKQQIDKIINNASININKNITVVVDKTKEQKEIDELEKELEKAKSILSMNEKQLFQFSNIVQHRLISILDKLNDLLFRTDMVTKSILVAATSLSIGISSIIHALFKKINVEVDRRILISNTKKVIKKLEKLKGKLPEEDKHKIDNEIKKLQKLI